MSHAVVDFFKIVQVDEQQSQLIVVALRLLDGMIKARLQQQTADPGFYQRPAEKVAAGLARLDSIVAELEDAYTRWEELESGVD